MMLNMTLAAALRTNAAFSFATGLLLALAPETAGDWLGVSIDGWLRTLGLALLGHGALLVWASQQATIVNWAKLNVAMIAPYPVLMVGLVVSGLVDTGIGRGLVLLDGTIVGFLCVAQWIGLQAKAAGGHPVPA